MSEPASAVVPAEPQPGLRVLVTGSSGGVGSAIVAHLVDRGCSVVGMDVAPPSAGAGTDGAVFVQADVSDRERVAAAVNTAAEVVGGLDAVVGNAGVVDTVHRAQTFSESAWRRDLSTNLDGQFWVLQAAYDHLVASGDGRVVLVASVAAESGTPGQAAYAAAKGGLISLGRSLAAEWASVGIRINSIMPGMIATPKVRALPDSTRDRFIGQIPLRRFAEPAEIAGTAAFLLSPAAGFITGSHLRVDGGMALNTSGLFR